MSEPECLPSDIPRASELVAAAAAQPGQVAPDVELLPNGHAEAEPPKKALEGKTAYVAFKTLLKQPPGQALIADVMHFVHNFTPLPDIEQMALQVHRFQQQCTNRLLQELSDAQSAPGSLVSEGFEKFIMVKLHEKVFAVDPDVRSRDKKLHAKLRLMRTWLTFKDLEVPSIEPQLLDLAIAQLDSMANQYKAPKDKLVCVVNACKVIGNVLTRLRTSSSPTSADDMLPMLIWCVVQANPENLIANIEYMRAFRHPSKLIEEENYWSTMLDSAVAFLQGSHLDLGVRENLKREIAMMPMTFEAVGSHETLRVGDIPKLLEEYHDMLRVIKDLKDSLNA
mmetsp:Transcript_77719/g.207626  ORF Transcript_77719/g.207626 Transcript_77719/m.207626 type:complete len:338 (+) Transcript_77719:60-1073(+)